MSEIKEVCGTTKKYNDKKIERKALIISIISRIFSYHLPLYLIVISLLFIALQKDPFSERKSQISTNHITNLNKSTTTNKEQSASQVKDSDLLTVTKLAIDGSKEKYDSIKDSYDKLFSMIAAIAALIAFLGFKGVDSFITAKKNSSETLEKAVNALKEAQIASEDLKKFKEEIYPKDNRAEINLMTGIVLRIIYDAYKSIIETCKPNHKIDTDPKIQHFLDLAIYYIDVVEAQTDIDEKLLMKAAVTRGNIYKRFGRIKEAYENLLRFSKKYPTCGDSSIQYNLACYSCLLAEHAESTSNHKESVKYQNLSLNHLRAAISCDLANKLAANTEEDFKYFEKNQIFLAMTTELDFESKNFKNNDSEIATVIQKS